MEPAPSQERAERGTRDHGPVVEPTELTRPTRFISSMHFRVDLPEVDFKEGAKVVGRGSELSKFKLAREERLPPAEVLVPELLGFEFGAVAAEAYQDDTRSDSPEMEEVSDPESLDTLPSLDDADYEILDAVESVTHTKFALDSETMLMKPRKKKRLSVAVKNVDPERWWIKETEADKKIQIQPLKLQKRTRKRKVRMFTSKAAYINCVKANGYSYKSPPKTRAAQLSSFMQGGRREMTQIRARKAVAVYNVVPYEDPHGRAFCTVNFHNNCVEDSEKLIPHGPTYSSQISENVLLKELYVEPKSLQEAEVNRAIGFDNKYLGLMAPCYVHNFTDRRASTIDGSEEYLWIREYFYRKKTGKEVGKWRWFLRMDKEKQTAEIAPIEQRFITQKQKLRTVIPRPISVNVIDRDVSEDIDIFD